MFEIFLTDISDGERVAELFAVDDRHEADRICITLQGFLLNGIEAHFVSDGEYPDDDAEVERKYAAYRASAEAEDA